MGKIRYGESEYYSGRANLQRVYYDEVEVGALITYKSTLREYFTSVSMIYVDAIQTKNKIGGGVDISVEETEDEGQYSIDFVLDSKKKYCDLIIVAGKVYKTIEQRKQINRRNK